MRSAIRQGLGLLCILLGTVVLGASPAFAEDALDKVVTVDIPAQPLTGARQIALFFALFFDNRPPLI